MNARKLAVIALVFGGLLAMRIVASSYSAEREADEAALEQRTAAFVEAVEAGNAKEVAGFWTDQGEYTGGDGVTIRGRANLVDAYQAHFQKVGVPEISHEIDGIRFLSRNTAVVEGTFESTYAKDRETERAGCSILYVREEDRWRIAVLREWSRETRLRDLGWLIGEWSAKTDEGEDSFRYESFNRTLGGEELPDIGPVTVKRTP